MRSHITDILRDVDEAREAVEDMTRKDAGKVARHTRYLYEALLSEGFTEEQAMSIVCAIAS